MESIQPCYSCQCRRRVWLYVSAIAIRLLSKVECELRNQSQLSNVMNRQTIVYQQRVGHP